MPEITVGLPVYNGGADLKIAIESVLMQSFQDWALLLYDNASTDGTSDMCRRYASSDPRVKYVRHDLNLGAYKNFAAVLAGADSEYFMFLSHDDFIGPRFLELSLAELKGGRELISVGIAPFDRPTLESIFMGFIGIEAPTAEKRIDTFVTLMADGNARFFSLYRTAVVKQIDLANANFFAGDWTIVVNLLRSGSMRVIYDGANGYNKSRGGNSAQRREFDALTVYDVLARNPFARFEASLPRAIRHARRPKLAMMRARFMAKVAAHRGRELKRKLIGN